ncbi:hypothetical protein [Desulfosporosinus sp. BG]|uniref:hypothetical protein n=1 Tax=Desulfosporosinus sp. BG TaxID=1633135 RepID=UPI00083B5265|nr:hypothetical protein [Desulfosporosinus sp. BG]ODA41952.1 hypothetical protein DSBG_1222 [Desulfosporosinus sp. BG]
MNNQYLVIPISDEKRQRLNYVCNILDITIEKFFDTALLEAQMEIISMEAFKPGGAFWNGGEQTFKQDVD